VPNADNHALVNRPFLVVVGGNWSGHPDGGFVFLNLAGFSTAAATAVKAGLLGVQFHNLGDRTTDGHGLL